MRTDSLDMLDALALARIFKLDRQTIYKLARESDLPCVRISPRCLRFERDAVAQWLVSHRKTCNQIKLAQ